MSARHATCGTALRWKSILDDDLDPVLAPWCDTCDAPAAVDEVDGDVTGILHDEAELDDHARLCDTMLRRN